MCAFERRMWLEYSSCWLDVKVACRHHNRSQSALILLNDALLWYPGATKIRLDALKPISLWRCIPTTEQNCSHVYLILPVNFLLWDMKFSQGWQPPLWDNGFGKPPVEAFWTSLVCWHCSDPLPVSGFLMQPRALFPFLSFSFVSLSPEALVGW